MSTPRLRHWRGVTPVAAPAGVAITARLCTSAADEWVLDQVAAHLGGLRRADLAATAHRPPPDPQLSTEQRRQVRRDELNARKKVLTAQSSARWANAIIAGNDDQYRLARDAQYRHIVGLRAAIATIEKRLAAPTADTLTASERKARRKAKSAKGYPTQQERFTKQQRLQHLRAQLARVQADHADHRVRVTEGGKRLARTRGHLDAAGLTGDQWRHKWAAARYRIVANGSPEEPFGNLTITVTPAGEVSVRLPKPLEHLANAAGGRYVLSCPAVFAHRGGEWEQRISGPNSVSYTITRKAGRSGRYLTAAWALPAVPYWIARENTTGAGADLYAPGPVVGVDLNEGHLALRRLDAHGNPCGHAERIDFDLAGSTSRRDAQVRHAITGLIGYARRFGIAAIAVEDLDFADARTIGRETMGRGARGKRFRRTVSGIPTAVFRHRLAGMCHRAGIAVFAVNPAYSSIWGAQHWQHPYENVTRHQAAATVIGRRAQGLSARRRKGVTPQRPEDRSVRATNQTAPTHPTASTGNRHRAGTRGTTFRQPNSTRKRLPGRATVTPAPANNGQPQM